VHSIAIDASDQDIVIVMAYIDPPLHALNVHPLFADLDLLVVDPSGKIWLGNGLSDQFSNIERVVIPQNQVLPGTYMIHIISSSYAIPVRVEYSLVVRGGFEQLDFTKNPALLPVSESQECIGGCGLGICDRVCVCPEGFTGRNCGESIEPIYEDLTYELILRHGSVQYRQFGPGNSSEIDSIGAIVISNLPKGFAGRVFACGSSEKSALIADGAWSCADVTKEPGWFDISESGVLYLALYVSYHESVAFSVMFTADPIIPAKLDSAVILVIVIGALAVVAVIGIVLVFRWFNSRRRIGGESLTSDMVQSV
jgi:hypothetical protein